MILATQSPTILDYAFFRGFVFIFSTSGVDIYRPSYNVWERVSFASLTNVTSGSVNESGIWLGTSDAGVYLCDFGSGDMSRTLIQYYAFANTTFKVGSDAINHVCGFGTSLLVTHDEGADFFSSPGQPFSYRDGECFSCAINADYIAYAAGTALGSPNGAQTLLHPTADWD